jgi:hypothetical protein
MELLEGANNYIEVIEQYRSQKSCPKHNYSGLPLRRKVVGDSALDVFLAVRVIAHLHGVLGPLTMLSIGYCAYENFSCEKSLVVASRPLSWLTWDCGWPVEDLGVCGVGGWRERLHLRPVGWLRFRLGLWHRRRSAMLGALGLRARPIREVRGSGGGGPMRRPGNLKKRGERSRHVQ